MFRLKRLSGFVIRCGLYYAVLNLPWTGLQDAYRWAFRAVGNAIFFRLGQGGSASFEATQAADRRTDTKVRVVHVGASKPWGSFDISTAKAGFHPTTFFVALVLATPVPWKRRLVALLSGGFLVCAFVAFRVWLCVIDIFSTPEGNALYTLSVFWKRLVHGTTLVLFQSPDFDYLVPAAIWALVIFRRADWAAMFGGSAAAGGQEPRRPG